MSEFSFDFMKVAGDVVCNNSGVDIWYNFESVREVTSCVPTFCLVSQDPRISTIKILVSWPTGLRFFPLILIMFMFSFSKY